MAFRSSEGKASFGLTSFELEVLLVWMHSSVGLGLFMLVSLLPRAAKAFKSAAPRGVPRGMTSSLSSSASGGAGEAASGIVANANVVRAKIDARCAELGRDPKVFSWCRCRRRSLRRTSWSCMMPDGGTLEKITFRRY